MVTAQSWDKFQKPSQIKPESQGIPKTNEASFEEEENPEPEQVQWGEFQSPETYQGPIDPTAEESTAGWLVRNIASNASRLGEQVLGKYGNIEKMGKNILSSFPEAGGLLGKAVYELIGPEKWEQMVRGPNPEKQIFPTSQELREVSEKGTKGYTAPKTKGEKKTNELFEDIGASLSMSR